MIGKIIIPARIDSTRLPRKALIDIDGQPMIVRTAMNAIEAVGIDHVYVATDSEEIQDCCDKYDIHSVLTSKDCLTGTDRVIEAANIMGLSRVYNLQGDEPLFPSEVIKKFIEKTEESNYAVDMGVTTIRDIKELDSPKIPKIVFNNEKELMYTSRSRIPGSKDMNSEVGYKQVCIYKYNITKLSEYIKIKNKTFFESIEDLELLRMLEAGVKVKCRFLNYHTHYSIDTPEDLINVRNERRRQTKTQSQQGGDC
tara:strand:+ start:1054 stop:1815 length:762 start_codon:yes stop_codon:yes gene_type:complete